MSRVYDTDILLNKMRTWLHYNNVAPHRIAVAENLSPGALRDIFKPTWNPKASTLRAIEHFIAQFEAEQRARAIRPQQLADARQLHVVGR